MCRQISPVNLCLFSDDTFMNVVNNSQENLKLPICIHSSLWLYYLSDNHQILSPEKHLLFYFRLRNPGNYSIITISVDTIESFCVTHFLGVVINS